MKIHATLLLSMAGLLALMNLPARAQDQVKPPLPPEHARGDLPLGPKPERTREKMVAYLGVLTGPVSPELRAQFGLMEGFGLQVVEVMPDSPASQAGLKEHDLLISFDDQKLVNTDQLQALVRSRKKDETVVLSLISGGQQKQLSLKIGERVTQVMPERPRGGFMPMMPPWSGSWNPGAGQMQEWQQKMDKYQREMREYQQQVQKWALEGRVGSFPPPPIFDGSHPWQGGRDGEREDRRPDVDRRERGPDGQPHDEGRRPIVPPGKAGSPPTGDNLQRSEAREYHESASITRSDESGIYSLRQDGDRTIFRVKPKDGEPQEWTVSRQEERAAVPELYRSKLQEMEELRRSVRRDQDRSTPPGREPMPESSKRASGI